MERCEVYNKPHRYTPERVGVEFARHASWFAISGVGAMIVFLCVPLVIPADYVPIALAVVATSPSCILLPKVASAYRCC